MADFDAQQPVRALATEFTTEVANSAGTTINPAEDYAQGSTTSGENNILAGGATTTAAPTYVTGTTNPLSLDTLGNLRVTSSAVALQNVNLTEIGGAAITLGQTTEAGSIPVTIASNQSPLTVSGNLTNNNAAPIADNFGVLPALANAAHPTWTEGDQVLLSEDLSGNLRVITGTGSTTVVTGTVAVTQSTSPWVTDVTQWANVALGSPSNYGTSPGAVEVIGVNAFITNTVPVTVATLPLPTGAATSANQTTEIGLLTTIASESLAQGSSTSGQLGNLVMGAATTAAPTYTTGDTYPLSLNTSGNLRVIDTAAGPVTPGTVATNSELAGGQYNSTPPTLTTGQQVALQVDANGRLLVDTNTSASIVPVLTYFTDAAVATSGTVTHSLAGPVTLDKIDATGSGEIKFTVAIGTTGSEVTYWNGFSSASNQDIEFALPYGYVIPTGSSVKVTLKNRDTAAQDLYVTFFSH
jgi:hypothetical protein